MSGKENRKEIALKEGKPFVYVTCPLCGLNRILHKHEKGRIRFGNFDLKKGYFIQVRYVRGGRGSGFWLNPEESLTLKDAIPLQEYRDLLLQIKKRSQELVRVLKKVK